MKRIFIKLLLFMLGSAFFVGGGYLSAVGYAHSGSSIHKAKIKIPYAPLIVRYTKNQINTIPVDIQKHFRIQDHGLLIPLGSLGALLAFIGFILILNSIFRFKIIRDIDVIKEKQESDDRISDAFVHTINPLHQPSSLQEDVPSVPKGETVSFDESMLDVEEDPFEALRDVNALITMSQANLEPAESERIISMFRSDLLPFTNTILDANSMACLAHQILESVIYRHQRQKEDITPDQFQQQDKRVYEVESKTFLRRYMPKFEKIKAGEMQECIGKTYDPVSQGAIQKRFLSEPEDWVDISLRNAAVTLAQPDPLS